MDTATQDREAPTRAPDPAPVSPAPPPATVRGKAVIPPAIMAARMQRYSVYLMIVAFALVGLNYAELSPSVVLWFAAALCAVFALLCAVTVVILNAVAWNFARLTEELRGGKQATDLR